MSLDCAVEGAQGYVWQRGLADENGEVAWEDIPGSNTSAYLISANIENMKYSYRCAATVDGEQLVSDAITLIDSELVEWLNEREVSQEMLNRAMNANSLESMVIEDENLCYVRTGEVYARIDRTTGQMIDVKTGLVVAIVDLENGMIYPISAETAASGADEAE